MKEFTAKSISCFCDADVVTLGLADDESSPSKYLLLQRTINPNTLDRNLGHDKIFIEVDSQSRSCYGGVKLIGLVGRVLTVRIVKDVTDQLGAELIRVHLEVNDEQLNLVYDHLPAFAAVGVEIKLQR